MDTDGGLLRARDYPAPTITSIPFSGVLPSMAQLSPSSASVFGESVGAGEGFKTRGVDVLTDNHQQRQQRQQLRNQGHNKDERWQGHLSLQGDGKNDDGGGDARRLQMLALEIELNHLAQRREEAALLKSLNPTTFEARAPGEVHFGGGGGVGVGVGGGGGGGGIGGGGGGGGGGICDGVGVGGVGVGGGIGVGGGGGGGGVCVGAGVGGGGGGADIGSDIGLGFGLGFGIGVGGGVDTDVGTDVDGGGGGGRVVADAGATERELPWQVELRTLGGQMKRGPTTPGSMSVINDIRWPQQRNATSWPSPPLATPREENVETEKAGTAKKKRKRPCKDPACQRIPSYGRPGEKADYCAKHKIAGMVNVISKKCASPGCLKGPSYGNPGSKRAVFCAGHRAPGQVNVVSPRCGVEGCPKGPSFGHPGAGQKAAFCVRHKLSGMVNVTSRRCKEEGCDAAPSFAFEGEKASFCGKHKQDGQVNVISRRCTGIDCTKVRA